MRRGCGGVGLAGGFGARSWDDLFHEVGVLGAGKLLSLLPLGVVVVRGRRQHGIWKKPTAGAKASRETQSSF